VLLEIKDISVSVPQRKKFELCFTMEHLYARVSGTTAPVAGIVYAWRDICEFLGAQGECVCVCDGLYVHLTG